ncbi:MAG: SNF2-related protein [Xenococcaceae cyanobacterium MO_167.B52]|nr:SNF2-related protein [Xenococcaceae cyanobacterium MO_167.B52]
MSIIHGSWILQPHNERFFVWGETWRSLVSLEITTNENGSLHPFCLDKNELISLLEEHKLIKGSNFNFDKYSISIPSQKLSKRKDLLPIFSQKLPEIDDNSVIEIHPWQVLGLSLNSNQAIALFKALPLNNINSSYLGSDIIFWHHIYRWSLDLINRHKFLPGVEVIDDKSYGVWQPLLDADVDLTRLARFTQLMPEACLSYKQATDLSSQELLLRFLSRIVDVNVRNNIETNISFNRAVSITPWLRSLYNVKGNYSLFDTNENNLKKIQNALYNWTLPIREYLVTEENTNLGQNSYRVTFILEPPVANTGQPQGDWSLKYYLQALDDSDFIVDSETIWQNTESILNYCSRAIEQPQETLLKGLGLAARIYSPIAESLEESNPINCQINPIQVYEFLRSIAWQLQDNGLGVIMPPGLASGENEQRLGVGIDAKVIQKKGERLSLKSLLQYKLSITVGDTTLSKSDFEKLLDQRSPIVEIDGKWLLLQPADVRAAQSVLNKSNEQLSLSVEDALRLSTGDTKTLVKLPVVKFEAQGVLQELISNLTENKAVEPISDIEGLNGTLRPYQARGVGWLAFLEKWSLGACLADDMGLGKCVSPDTKLQVNGILKSAQDIWKTYSQDTKFDGEGYWSKPSQKLSINSIDESTGKIILTTISNLYRQKIKEKVIQINLEDGNSITITKRHKLLTNKGWKNNLNIGDYVSVPSQIYSDKNILEDRDLVKLMAWQIAEGWENNKRATVNIFQKSTSVLSDLCQVIIRLSKKYKFKINQPKIRVPENGKVPYLSINSKEYQEFLQSKGYQWGQKSRGKSIPSFIMEANLSIAKIFLRNYFDAEASVDIKSGVVEISSASSLLIQQLSVLLRRFGIWLRIAQKPKRATNGNKIFRDYYIGTMGGNAARKFCELIGFEDSLKQQKIEQICIKSSNTNVEGIPASKVVAEVVTNTKLPIRHFGMHNTVYIDGSQEFSHQSLTKVVSCLDNIIEGQAEADYRQLKPSKWTKNTLAAYQQLDKQYLLNKKRELQSLLDKEVFYCRIESIEEIDYEGWVYDFEVPVHHNFVANNIICHNTVQTIGFLLNLKQEDSLVNPTLLVCPTSVLNNWEREVRKFAPTLSTVVHHGDRRKRGKSFIEAVKNKNLVITSYSLVHRDSKTLNRVNWQGVVLDEAQNIKNSTAKQSQAVRQIPAGFKIALTGTPVENRLSELWSILDFLNPDFLGNKTFFQKRFANPIEKYGDRDSLNILRSLVQPFILRRLKTDKNIIQDLPEKQEMNVFCGLSEEQAEFYQKLVDESLVKIEDSEGIKRHGLILTLLLRLKQVCNHPELISSKTKTTKPDKIVADVSNFCHRSGKLMRLTEMLEEIVLEKSHALIFTQFSEWGKILKFYLENTLNQEVLFLYGATRRKQRQEMIDRFQNDPNAPQIFILSLKAGGTGLNLTRANHVFHVDRWWNPAVENQATDRAFRIGQKRNVQVHKFVCSGTLEERINEIIESKQELAEQTIDAGEQWLTKLDTNQLRSLLLLDRDSILDEDI